MTTCLYYCQTNYNLSPPLDINPLILRKHAGDKILALCAREQMVQRIENQADQMPYCWFQDQDLVALGWWQLQEYGLLTTSGKLDAKALRAQDAVIIVGRERIDPCFMPLCRAVEYLLCANIKS